MFGTTGRSPVRTMYLIAMRLQGRYLLVLTLLITTAVIIFQRKPSDNVQNNPPQMDEFVKQNEFDIHLNSTMERINPNGSFLDRVHTYNGIISNMRQEVLVTRGQIQWRAGDSKSLELVEETDDNFLESMSKLDFVTAIILPWRSNSETRLDNVEAANHHRSNYLDGTVLDTTEALSMSNYTKGRLPVTPEAPNYLVTNYYQWVGAQQLCDWIRTGETGRKPYHIKFNYTCFTDMTLSEKPQPIQPIAFNWKMPTPDGNLPMAYYLDYPSIVFYLHIVQDAIVTKWGQVVSHNIKIVPKSCKPDRSSTLKRGVMTSPLVKEVLVITQFWGNGFFHRMIETLPRLAPYKQFLQDNPLVKIVVPKVDTMMKKVMAMFEVDEERLVVAPVRAELVYLPQGSQCGHVPVQQTQLLSHIYRKHTETHLKPGPRNKLVLIQRSGSRHILKHKDLVKVLLNTAGDYGLEFAHWTDKPLLSFEDGMTMFHEAVMVVAPHGAGEANLIFSQPGTYVIELVCNKPHLNLCYQRETFILGHRYYAIPSSRGCEGFIDVSIDTIKSAVVYYLNMWKRVGN